jgi:mevalonate kinase
VPVTQVKARVVVLAEPLSNSGAIRIEAPDINLSSDMAALPADNPLRTTIQNTFAALNAVSIPAFTLRITSTIPVASGMGSGAAVSVAIIRAVSAFLGQSLPNEKVSALAYQTEKHYHGTPSGIDNTVVTFARPVYFELGRPIQTFSIGRPFTIVIGDTGIQSSTAEVVGAVRQRWQDNPDPIEGLFAAIGAIASKARQAIERGQSELLGQLMDENHSLLQQLGVSTPELDRLVEYARAAGAWGAKLSGAGGGGNIIALAPDEKAAEIARILQENGAVHTILTTVSQPENR